MSREMEGSVESSSSRGRLRLVLEVLEWTEVSRSG